jgi:hypothetical protein
MTGVRISFLRHSPYWQGVQNFHSPSLNKKTQYKEIVSERDWNIQRACGDSLAKAYAPERARRNEITQTKRSGWDWKPSPGWRVGLCFHSPIMNSTRSWRVASDCPHPWLWQWYRESDNYGTSIVCTTLNNTRQKFAQVLFARPKWAGAVRYFEREA